MSTIELAQEAYEKFHEGFTLGDKGVAPTWAELLEGHKGRWRAVVVVSRAPLFTEIHDLKMAAAGGEDVPGAAHAVTVDDIVRWRVEAAEEIERLRVRINGLESSLRGSVRAADGMRAQLSERWSLIKRMRQDVEGLGLALPPGVAQTFRDAYLAKWNGLNHLDSAWAGIRAMLVEVGASLIKRWPPADQDGEPVSPSPADPVRAALEKAISDALYKNQFEDDWRELVNPVVEAALSVSTPTGEGVLVIPPMAKDQREYLADLQVAANNYDPNTMVRGHDPNATLAHPPQEGERDGWKLVPVEATEKMMQAGLDAPGDKRPLDWERKDVPEYMPWVWKAMLDAAPTAPLPSSESSGEEA